MAARTTELLINGTSRQSKEQAEAVLAACEKYGITLDRKTEVRGSDLDKAFKAIKRRAPTLLLVAGGDGTVSNALHFFADGPTELGIVPLGTTNNFARSLALPLNVDGAIERIANGKPVAVDLGRVKNNYFANVAGVGLSAVIAGSISDKTKRRFGRLAYAIEGAFQLLRHKPFLVTVEDKDHELQLHFETHQIIIANGRYHAGKEIAADASLVSRELIIFALGGRGRLSFIRAMIDFYIGKRTSIKHSSYLVGRDVRITTSTKQPIELDGEVHFTTPCDVAVRPAAVKVRVAR